MDDSSIHPSGFSLVLLILGTVLRFSFPYVYSIRGGYSRTYEDNHVKQNDP